MTKLHAILNQHRFLVEMMIISVGGLILTLPTIIYGFPADGHDSIVHLTWYTQFSEQLISGQTYPRWLLRENAGLGSPTFFYYGPVPYYITLIFQPLSRFDPYGWYQMGLSASMAIVLSGITCYFWIRSRTNSHAAIFGALIYMIMPYHMAIDLYERAAFAELWAFVWMPLILYFVGRSERGNWINAVGIAFSYSLLVMTHLPTTLMFSPIPIAYAFLTRNREQRLRVFVLTVMGMIWGIVSSAIYLLPALGTQNLVFVGREAIKALYLSNFLFQGLIPETTFDLKLTAVVLTMALFGICGVILGNSASSPAHRQERMFWVFVSLIAILMMTPLSEPVIWVVPLHRIQFPWRYNTILTVSVTAIMAIGIFSLSKPFNKRVIASIVISILIIGAWLFLDIRQGLIKSAPPHYVRGVTTIDRKPLNEMIERGTFDFNYRPRTVQTDLRLWAEDIPKISVATGGSQISIEKWESRLILLSVNLPTDSSLTIGQLYYPGWTAQIIGQSCCLPANPSEPDGLVTVQAPAGSYELALRLVSGPLEMVGQIISFFSLTFMLTILLWHGIVRYRFTGTKHKSA
jgi:hypothetical protein